MNRIIALIFLITTSVCFSMNRSQQQEYEKIGARLLQLCTIPQRTKNPTANTFINRQLHAYIQNDDVETIAQLLPTYDAHYDIENPQTSVVFAVQQRIKEFAQLNRAMKKGWWLPRINRQADFLQRRNIAFKIYALLNEHRDRGLQRAIDELNISLVRQYTKLGARLEWQGEGGTALDHAREVFKKEYKKRGNLDNKRKISVILTTLYARRDQLLYWKIRFVDLDIVRKMVGIGASPHCYIQDEHKTALTYALSLIDQEKKGPFIQQRQSIYDFLKGVADHTQAERLAAAEKNSSPDDPSFELLAIPQATHLQETKIERPLQEDEGHLESLESLARTQCDRPHEPFEAFKFFVPQQKLV